MVKYPAAGAPDTWMCVFLVTDKITTGEVKVVFCPIHGMLGNFFTMAC